MIVYMMLLRDTQHTESDEMMRSKFTTNAVTVAEFLKHAPQGLVYRLPDLKLITADDVHIQLGTRA